MPEPTMRGTDIAYDPRRCAVLRSRMALLGTVLDLRRRLHRALLEVRALRYCHSVCFYAMCRTGIAYVPY
eukprot:938676-Rhodomonas_salina.1